MTAKLERSENMMIWRSFSGNRLNIDQNDHWYEFPHLTISETYT